MRCPFQEGEFPAPVKYGYSAVGRRRGRPGRIDAAGASSASIPIRTGSSSAGMPYRRPRRGPGPARHACRQHGNRDQRAVGRRGPDRETGLRSSARASSALLSRALAARLPGAEVELIDIDPGREPWRLALGCRFATSRTERGPRGRSRRYMRAEHPTGCATALALAGFEATVVEMSWYGPRIVPLALGAAFHSRRLAPCVRRRSATVPAARRERWSHRRRLALALSLLRDPVFDQLLSGESDFAGLPELMPFLAASPAGVLCHTLRYE